MCKRAHNFLNDLLLFWEYILSFENISFDLNYKLQAECDGKHHAALIKRSAKAVLACVKRYDQNTCSAELSIWLSEQGGIQLKAELTHWNIYGYLCFCIGASWKEYDGV